MSSRPAWLKPLLGVLLLTLAGSLWQVGQWISSGVRLQTDITQLVPAGGMDPVNRRLYDDLLTQGTSRLIVVVEGTQAAAVEGASIALQDELADLPGVASVETGPDPVRFDRLVEFLLPYRAVLLTAGDREALTEDAARAVAQWGEEDPFFRPLSVDRDPLGTLGRFIVEALPAPGRIDSDGFFYWLERDNGQLYAIATFVELSPGGIGTERNDRLRNDLRALFDTVKRAHDVALNASSVIFHASSSKRQAKWESSVFGTLSAVLVVGMLACGFRSFRPVVELVVVIGIALLSGFAAADWLFDDLHVLTLVMALPVIGITVDYVIHSQVNQVRSPPGKAPGLPPHLLRALCWGCASSALGYAALAGVDIAVLRQVSVVLVAGLVTALLWVVAWAYVFPVHRSNARIERLSASYWIQRLARGRDPGRGRLVAGLAAMTVAGFAAAWFGIVTVVNEPDALHHVEPDLIRADRQVQERLGLAGQRQSLVVEGESVEQVLERQEALLAALKERFEVRGVGVSNIVPAEPTQRANRELVARAYAAASIDGRIPRPAENAGPAAPANGGILQPADLPDAIRDRLPAFHLTPNAVSPWAAVGISEAVDWTQVAVWCNGQPGCRVVDSMAALTNVLADTHYVARIALYTAVLLVALVLVARYRARGVWACTALLLVLLGGHVIPGAFGLPLTLFGTAGLFILLGLSVDYLVFTTEMREHRDFMWLAFVLSAMTTLLTFGFLLFSLTPAVRMIAAPVVAGLPLMLATLIWVQARMAPPSSTEREERFGGSSQ